MAESTGPTRRARGEVSEAWWCAANLRGHDADPGPRAVYVATSVEPRWADRCDVLIERYVRQLLVICDAEVGRLGMAAVVCDAAVEWLREGGGEGDPQVRARMLATHRRRLHADVLGKWMPDTVAQEAADVAADRRGLDDDIDGRDNDRGGRQQP